MMSEMIRSRFKIVEPPKYNLEESSFIQACKKVGIFVSIQGTVAEGEIPNQMLYQLVAISGDIRQMDKFVESIKNS